jgi:hypothetical protein
MVKSDGTRFMNRSIGYVYNEDLDLRFKELAEEGSLLEHSIESTERLDSVIIRIKDLF